VMGVARAAAGIKFPQQNQARIVLGCGPIIFPE
jgi:hypothetical protein